MPNDNNLENLTVDEINELYKDTTPSYHYSSPTSPQK